MTGGDWQWFTLQIERKSPVLVWTPQKVQRIYQDGLGRTRMSWARQGPMGRTWKHVKNKSDTRSDWRQCLNTFWSYHIPTGGRSVLTRTVLQESVEERHINMKINQVVVLYLDADQIVRPVVPPDVSPVKGILSSYSFLFLDTPGHYCIRKYNCWCKACSLVRGCGHDTESRGQSLHVPGCLHSNLTVWRL